LIDQSINQINQSVRPPNGALVEGQRRLEPLLPGPHVHHLLPLLVLLLLLLLLVVVVVVVVVLLR
jgi:hypothetical protein